MRKDWDSYWLDIAKDAAERGTCDRLHVGCVIVKDNKIVSTGYNGSIHGHPHCDEEGHLLNDEGRCIRTLHAEENAILHADREKLIGATAYVTHEPCENCTKRLNQAGIKRVVFSSPYLNKWNEVFKAGMQWDHVPSSKLQEEAYSKAQVYDMRFPWLMVIGAASGSIVTSIGFLLHHLFK